MCGGRDPGSLVCEPKDGYMEERNVPFRKPIVVEHAKGCRDHDGDNKTVHTAGMGKGTQCDSVA